jgi:hypothetical protein
VRSHVEDILVVDTRQDHRRGGGSDDGENSVRTRAIHRSPLKRRHDDVDGFWLRTVLLPISARVIGVEEGMAWNGAEADFLYTEGAI